MNLIRMNAFISQPMNGKTYSEIQDERQRIIKAMEEQHHIDIGYVTNDFDYNPESPARTVMLGNSITKMEASDIIIFVKTWPEASGCRVEYLVAKEYLDYWRENGGPRVFVECLDGYIIEVEEFAGPSNYATAFDYHSTREAVRQRDTLRDRVKELEDHNQELEKRIYELQERIHSREDVCNNQYYRLNELEDQLAKKSEKIREQSVEIAALTHSNIHAKSKLIERIKELEDECDQQAEDNKKLSIELADKKELIEKKDKRIEELKRMANSIYGLSCGGVVCYDCKRKYEDRIKNLESCIDIYKATVENKDKTINILLEAVKKIEANKYDENDIVGNE